MFRLETEFTKKHSNLRVLNKVFETSKGKQMFMQLDIWLKPEIEPLWQLAPVSFNSSDLIIQYKRAV